jgi:hypothetical protein
MRSTTGCFLGPFYAAHLLLLGTTMVFVAGLPIRARDARPLGEAVLENIGAPHSAVESLGCPSDRVTVLPNSDN